MFKAAAVNLIYTTCRRQIKVLQLHLLLCYYADYQLQVLQVELLKIDLAVVVSKAQSLNLE